MMNNQLRKYGRSGFSLIELMVVLAIVATLLGIGVPNFMQYKARAKQTEAKTMLSHIYLLMQTHYLENDTFRGASLKSIGFESKANDRYRYRLRSLSAQTWTAEAISKAKLCQNSQATDKWQIDQAKALVGKGGCN
jgi:type IV pilus assembly protein PilA